MIIQPVQEPESSSISRFLIRVSGGDPEVVDRYPHERPRYIGLGWTMLMTASLATTGMAVLLSQIWEAPLFVVLVLAAGWGLFVLGIDYLVVSFVDHQSIVAHATSVPGERPPGRHGWSTAIRTIVRVVFAVIVGFAVGESLVIGVFASAANEYLDDRAAAAKKAELCVVTQTLANYRPEVVAEPDCRQQLEKAHIRLDTQTPAMGTSSTTVPPNATDSQVAADYARLAELDKEIKFQSDRAQCELYPQNFSADQNANLGCSGKAGNGPAHDAALAQVAALQGEKDGIQARLAELAHSNAAAAAAVAQAEAKQTEARAKIDEDKRNSPPARSAEERKSQLDAELTHILAPGPARAYGLSERFEATEKAVSAWIRWGLRMLFVIADLAPILMKITMGPSRIDIDSALSDYGELQPRFVQAARQRQEFEALVGSGSRSGTPPPPPPNGAGTYANGDAEDSTETSTGRRSRA